MGYEFLTREVEGQIAVVTLNRPERRNALSAGLMEEVTACLDEVSAGEARVVILGAAGKVFSSGHDLKEMVGRSVDDYRRIFDLCNRMMARIQSIRQPVIAQVQGIATAAGCQLVAACDLAVASSEARFATPGVKIGLFCTTPMVPLTRAIGRKRAMEMLLTGRVVDACTAAEWGLVNRVVAPEELEAAARALALEIAAASDYTVAIGKEAFYTQIELEQANAYGYAKEIMTMNSLAEDAQEGITAFLEKRTPCWKGK